MFKLDLIINIFRTSFKQVPSINGKEVDLYLLYWLVTAQGGWEKVGNITFILWLAPEILLIARVWNCIVYCWLWTRARAYGDYYQALNNQSFKCHTHKEEQLAKQVNSKGLDKDRVLRWSHTKYFIFILCYARSILSRIDYG